MSLPEMVEAGGHQKYGAWEMEIVSKPIYIYIVKLIIAVNTFFF